VKLETSVAGEKGRVLWLYGGVQKTGQKSRLAHMEEATADLPSAKSHFVVRDKGENSPCWHGLPFAWVGCEGWEEP